MKISEFVQRYPMFEIDFALQVQGQKRIYDGASLDQLPLELDPEFPYRVGGRGRPNLNQTLTHSQCATCHRVLRNDLFYTLPSMMKNNMIFSHCRECNQQRNAVRYDAKAELIRARRIAIWQFLAPRCANCGFDRHMSAMDMHHIEQKESQVAELITNVTLILNAGRIEALLREAAKCIPLCSNCHRMLHANVIQVPENYIRPVYRLAELLVKLKSLE